PSGDQAMLGATTPRIETYAYDRTLRLMGAQRPMGNFAATGGAFESRTYQYDGRGNRTQLEEDGFVYDLTSGTAPAVDQLTGWGSSSAGSLLKYSLAHDADGRVTQKRWAATMSGGPVYALGFEYGQAVGVATETVFRAVNVNGTYYNYFYDALGRRRLKSNPYGTTDEYFHSVSNRMLTDRGNNGLSTPIGHFTLDDYVWLAGRPVALVRGKFSAAWARQPDSTGDCSRDGESVACGVYFPVTDHIGKPVVMLDASRRVTGAADTDPFGHVNRVTYNAETAHPYAHSTSTTLASFSQPKENASVQVRMRARYHVVDTEPGADFVRLVDPDTSSVLDSQSGERRGRVTTPWVTPSNGNLSVSFASNASGLTSYQGAVVEGYEYQRYQTGAQAFWIPLSFPGQYHDAETDLFENWNRYYDPSAGRYLQPEPMLSSYPVPLAGYVYASSNPMFYYDPSGWEPIKTKYDTVEAAALGGFAYLREKEKIQLEFYEFAFSVLRIEDKYVYTSPQKLTKGCTGGGLPPYSSAKAQCHTHPLNCNEKFSRGDMDRSGMPQYRDVVFYMMYMGNTDGLGSGFVYEMVNGVPVQKPVRGGKISWEGVEW
ncbi:MAG: RHS repeat-associated core domain-containing protein, partial [Verrucomicrobiaceae bacterium]